MATFRQDIRGEKSTDTGVVKIEETLNIGADAAGVDFKLFGETADKYCNWNHGSDRLDVNGAIRLHNHDTTGGYALEAKVDFFGTATNHVGVTSTVELEPAGATATNVGIQGVQGVARLKAANTMTGGSMIGTYGQVCNLGTLNGLGIVGAGLYGLIEDGGVYTSVSHIAALWVDSHLAQTVSSGSAELIFLTNNGATTLGNAFYINAGDKITNLFTIASGFGMVSDATTSDYTFTKTRLVKVVVGGETGYIVVDIV